MPITYEIDDTNGIIIEVWHGEVTIATLVEHWRGYLQDEQVLRLRRTLVDMRDAEVRFSSDQLLAAVTDVVVPALGGRDWVTAMVVKNVDQFHAGAQYQVFARLYSYDSIFSDLNTAAAWLLKQELRVR